MSVKRESRHEVIEKMRRGYAETGRQGKTQVIDQAVELTGYDRDYVRQLLKRGVPRKDPTRHRAGRGRTYKHSVLDAVVMAADATGWICSKRLVAALPDLIPALEKEGALTLTPSQREQVLRLSARTIDRRLAVERRARRPRGLVTTRPGSLLRSQIPIRTVTPQADESPGFLEIDLVAHGGASGAGEYLYTLTAVDSATGWTECAALRNKRQFSVVQALHDIRQRFPFPIRGLDCDNGSEFLNAVMVRYCTWRGWTLTRSRSYHKNDQAHVEEKNGSLVRQLIGYERYEGIPAAEQMTLVYSLLHSYFNYYLPTLKLERKERVGSRVHKHYGPPLTPYRRAQEAVVLGPHVPTSPPYGPLALRQRLDRELAHLYALRVRSSLVGQTAVS